MLGNEALFEGAVAAGARFYAGYPITPSSEIAELAARRLPALGGTYVQMEDEMGSLAAVIGASLAGVMAFTATSGPGFSLMQEHIGLAAMAEVPCVIIDVQRSGPSTGLATRPAQADVMQARWGTHGDHAAVALAPASVEDCFFVAARAFELAELLRAPVIVLADEVIGHLRERATLPAAGELQPARRRWPACPPDEYRPYAPDPDGVPPLAAFGSDYIFRANSSMHDERGYPSSSPEVAARVIRRLCDKVAGAEPAIARWRAFGPDGRAIAGPPAGLDALLVSYGAAARAARAAAHEARTAGVSAAVLQLELIWPFPVEVVEQWGLQARRVLVPEMNLGQLVLEVERVIGKRRPVTGVHRSDGEALTPDDILPHLLGVRA
jgi:2-oxoglutarate ferredoxin oxidoreductase subunit alpha